MYDDNIDKSIVRMIRRREQREHTPHQNDGRCFLLNRQRVPFMTASEVFTAPIMRIIINNKKIERKTNQFSMI